MPLVNSRNPAAGDAMDYNRTSGDKKHRSHRFVAANTVIPYAQRDELPGWEQHLELTEQWLKGDLAVPEIADKWASGPIVTVQINVPAAVAPGEDIPLKVTISSRTLAMVCFVVRINFPKPEFMATVLRGGTTMRTVSSTWPSPATMRCCSSTMRRPTEGESWCANPAFRIHQDSGPAFRGEISTMTAPQTYTFAVISITRFRKKIGPNRPGKSDRWFRSL